MKEGVARVVAFFVLAFFCSACAIRHGSRTSPDLMQKIDRLMSESMALQGKPYRYQGRLPWPMDCSGYICYIYSQVGIHLPRTSNEIGRLVEPVRFPLPGDLVFFKGRNLNSNKIGHVGMIIANDENGIRMIHSSASRGIVVENPFDYDYYRKRFIKYGRIPDLYR